MALAEDHRVCVEWTWLGKRFGFRDVSPRPDVDITLTADYGTYNYDEDAEEDYGRRDQPGDFAPKRMLAHVEDGTNTLWGWDFLDDNGCTDIFDTEASEVTF
ncbi:MAG TPA: hypothetical protein VK034_05020, partial [Enhygromyxa sp.]|nr:hypothetical protein [Enhygromyxa sp.]